ncbi:MAG: putative membrane protein YhiD involved in acid resistance [Patiriisocius sp.]|jgi:uncharacterized membrane protein YhiD involved in acid resistance
MIDFFAPQSNSPNIGHSMIMYAILLAIILSSILAVTYEKTNRKTVKNRHFIQGMILIAVVVSILMQAIGDSLARSLGMLGALSIIRFRNTVSDPRNIVFMFASISIGIACGVYGFLVASIGTAGFVLTATVLSLSPLSQKTNMIGDFEIQTSDENIPDLDDILKKYCKRHRRIRISVKTIPEVGRQYIQGFQVRLMDGTKPSELIQQIEQIEQNQKLTLVKFNVKDTAEII